MRCDLFLIDKPALRRLMVLALAVIALGSTGIERAVAATQQDALAATRFAITVDGYEIASFSELQGISTSVEVPLASGGLQTGPATTKIAVVLRRGLNRSMELWTWHEAVILGDVAAGRKDATIVMYGADGAPVARYHLTNAWPSKIEVGSLKAGASEVLMETVTMTCELIQRVSV